MTFLRATVTLFVVVPQFAPLCNPFRVDVFC